MTATRSRLAKLLKGFAITLAFCAGGQTFSQPMKRDSAAPAMAEFLATSSAPGNFKVSPDGQWLAWTESRAGANGIWVRPVGREAAAVRVWPGDGDYEWAAGSRQLIVAADRNGDENHRLWLVDIASRAVPPRDLTPHAGAKSAVVKVIRTDPRRVVIRHNARNGKVFDLYALNPDTGAATLMAANPGSVLNWIVDEQGRLRARVNQTADARHLEFADGAAPGGWRRVLQGGIDNELVVHGFNARGDALLLSTNYGRDKIELLEISVGGGSVRVLHANKTADLDFEEGQVRLAPVSRQPLVATAEPDYPEPAVLHAALAHSLSTITVNGPARIRVFSMDGAERLATVEIYDGLRMRAYLLDLETRRSTVLADLPRVYPAQTRPIRFISRDGLAIHGYITLPLDDPQKPLPAVVRVHGGPWYRDIWGNTDFNPAALQVQFLASLGYAVVQINFRGSTGYGRQFSEAAVGEFGGAMLNDIADGVQWAIAQGLVDAKRVAIMGTSYGGYATLMSLAKWPELYACGVAISAATDLAPLIESFPADWALHLKQWHKYVGDPADARQRRAMDAISPVNHATSIKQPLFMAHGDNDPRVGLAQADRFVQALRASGGKVEYLVFKDEGHVITRDDSRARMYEGIQRFLAACLQQRETDKGFHGSSHP
jgi:dipeptidyl aminopeptidase/acylaminoacyl peptidase